MSVHKRCNCPCHRMAGMRHMIPCCSEPTADRARRRTVIPEPPLTKERFVAIFHEEGVDKEWAEIVYGRMVKAKVSLSERAVREAAKGWAKDDGF